MAPRIPAVNSKSKKVQSVLLNDSALEVIAHLGTEAKFEHLRGWPMLSKPTTTAVKRTRGGPSGSKTKVKPAAIWRDLLILNPGEVLRLLERA